MKKLAIRLFTPISFLLGFTIKLLNIPVCIDGMKIKFPKEMTKWELGFSIFGTYEKGERKLAKKHLTSSESVLELGACIGVVSITINRMLSDNTKHVAVEANPNMIKYLEKNKEANKAKFFIENVMISKEKEIEFYAGGSSFLSSTTRSSGIPIKINGKTIQQMEEKYFPFTTLVMDIEGGELQLLRENDFSKLGIKKIIFETHAYNNILSIEELEECYSLLTKYGFESVDKFIHIEFWEKNNNSIQS